MTARNLYDGAQIVLYVQSTVKTVCGWKPDARNPGRREAKVLE